MDLIFSHSGCLDGQCAVHILKKTSLSNPVIVWLHAGKLTVDEIKQRMTNRNVTRIFILDLSVSQDVFDYLVTLVDVDIRVFDHHEPRNYKTQKERLDTTNESGTKLIWSNTLDKCASKLVWDYFFLNRYPPIVEYIDDRDRGVNKLPRTEEVLCAIHANVRTRGFEQVYDTFDADVYASQGVLLLADRKNRVEEILRQGYERTLKIGDQSFSVLLVTGDRSLRSDVHGKECKHDVSVFYTLDLKTKSLWLAWRSNKVDLVKLLSNVSWIENGTTYFGGGHPSAAGCTINESSKVGETPVNLLNWVDVFFEK